MLFTMFHYADETYKQTSSNGFEDPEFESGVGDTGSGSEELDYTFNVKAQAGVNTVDGNFETIEMGKTDISKTTNVGIPGVWMYQINEGSIIKPSKEIMCYLQ